MGHKIEIEDSDVQIITEFCHIALRANGIQYLAAVNRIMSLMPKPEPKEEEKDG